ncbi:MAG: GAF domain-containing protein [Desulfobulbaceae bacterium]|nr:GAF domain-containing protein [Desulfobulbaceae bacterium]
MKHNNLYYKLNVIFILMLIFPCAGFIYFGIKYNFLQDKHTELFIAVGLIYIFVGFNLLRKLFDNIIGISKTFSEKINRDILDGEIDDDLSEMQQIVQSFTAMEHQFQRSSAQLARKSSEVSILKELSDLCYVTLDPWEILHVTLERALLLAKADMGSILILDKDEENKSFVVKASIGLGDFVKMNDKIDYEKSIAKYAVINKTPLIIDDIEKESRFGRSNRVHYGTKSFVIMPIKTIKDVIGVLTISRKDEDEVFSQEEVESLTPLLSSAAFTYENIRLLGALSREEQYVNIVKKMFKTLNSSLRDSELLNTIMNEAQEVLPFEIAAVMVEGYRREDKLSVVHLQANETVDISVGDQFPYKDSILDKIMRSESVKVIDDTSFLAQELDGKLFVNHGRKSCLLAPITTRGQVNGILVLYAKDSSKFHENSVIAEFMTNIISFALEERRLVSAAIKKNRELMAIQQIGSAIASSTFDIQRVLSYTMDMIRTLMNVEAGALALVKDGELEFAVAFDVDLSQLQKFKVKLGQGIAGAVAARGETIIENNALESKKLYSQIDQSTGFETRSVLCVPMISQGKVIGIIEVLNKRGGDFTDGDKDILQSISISVSIAIENSRLYKETLSMAEKERGIRGMFQKFVPKEIIDKIIHGSDSDKTVIDELKTITLLNIDIRGFSGLTREIGPQKSVALLNYFFSVMGGIVFKHGGIVDKYLGDGFLALFGAPVSTSLDAENALSAALEMQAAITAVNEGYIQDIVSEPVNIGVSVFTGEVVVGNIGFDMKMDYTVIGDAVNNVFKLQELTKFKNNSVVIAENTSRAAQSPLELSELDSNVDDIKVYELLGRK